MDKSVKNYEFRALRADSNEELRIRNFGASPIIFVCLFNKLSCSFRFVLYSRLFIHLPPKRKAFRSPSLNKEVNRATGSLVHFVFVRTKNFLLKFPP